MAEQTKVESVVRSLTTSQSVQLLSNLLWSHCINVQTLFIYCTVAASEVLACCFFLALRPLHSTFDMGLLDCQGMCAMQSLMFSLCFECSAQGTKARDKVFIKFAFQEHNGSPGNARSVAYTPLPRHTSGAYFA